MYGTATRGTPPLHVLERRLTSLSERRESGSSAADLVREIVPAGLNLWPTIRPIWQDLLEQTDETSAFLSGRWMASWIDAFGERLGTSGIIWRTGAGRPVGCTLFSAVGDRIGPVPVRAAYLNASGAAEVGCDHNDILVVDSHRSAVYDDLVSIFATTDCDELRLGGVREPLFEEMERRWPRSSWAGYGSESPYVDLDAVRSSGGDYLCRLSANTRSQIRRSIRMYEDRFGEPSVEVARGPSEALLWFDEMVQLHEQTWRKRGEKGGFGGKAKVFHHSLIGRSAGLDGAGELGVDVVRVRFGGQTIGLVYNLVYRGRVYFYQSGLRYHGDGKLKPGLVTHALAIGYYADRGDAEYDFLGGERLPVQYKRQLTTDSRLLYWMHLPSAGAKMAALRGLRRLWRGYRTRAR